MRRGATLIVLAFLCLAVTETSLWAQRRSARQLNYNRSPFSPYVGLFRGDTGGLSPYFTFVRPQVEQNRFNSAQQQQYYQLNQQVNRNEYLMLNPQAAERLRGDGGFAEDSGFQNQLQVRPTTGASGFSVKPHASYFNLSHYYYYPVQPGAGAGR